MKTLLLISIFLYSSSKTTAIPVGKSVEGDVVRKGILPPFDDPLHLNDTTVHVEEPNVKGVFSISDSVVTGLSTVVDDLKLNILTLRFEYAVRVPQAAVQGLYVANGTLTLPESPDNHLITGHGAYSGLLKNLRINAAGRIRVNASTTRVRITGLRLTVVFDEVAVFAENAAINGETVNWDDLNPVIKPVFDFVFVEHNEVITETVTEIINKIIGKYTLPELIEIIIGGGGRPITKPCLKCK